MRRGFTLIEIMVVVSILSMLSSVVVASVTPARSKARDSQRVQQIRQVDLAIQLYQSNNGHAPYLDPVNQSLCKVQANTPESYSDISACFAVSTASIGTPERDAWETLKQELSQYISIPEDPCPTCTSDSSYSLGYTYVSPYAMQYYCGLYNNCTANNNSYQVYTGLENDSNPSGSNSGGSNFYTSPPPLPHNYPPLITGINLEPGSDGIIYIQSGESLPVEGQYLHGELRFIFTDIQGRVAFTIMSQGTTPTTVPGGSIDISLAGTPSGDYQLTVQNINGTSNAVHVVVTD